MNGVRAEEADKRTMRQNAGSRNGLLAGGSCRGRTLWGRGQSRGPLAVKGFQLRVRGQNRRELIEQVANPRSGHGEVQLVVAETGIDPIADARDTGNARDSAPR